MLVRTKRVPGPLLPDAAIDSLIGPESPQATEPTTDSVMMNEETVRIIEKS